MPWESRIQTEFRRRAVLAVLMLVLLVGTSGAAMLMSVVRRPRLDRSTPNEQIGSFAVTIPAGFQLQMPDGDAEAPAKRFMDPSRRLVLTLAAIPDDQIRPPIVAHTQAMASLAPAAGRSEPRVGQFGPLTVMQTMGYSLASTPSGAEIRQKHLIAVATVDGRRYVAAELSGQGNISTDDVQIMESVMLSLADTRYAQATDAQLRVDDLVFPRHAGLLPLYKAVDGDGDWDATEALLLYVPTEAAYFFRLPVQVLEADALWEQVSADYDGPEVTDPWERAVLAVHLMLRRTYGQVHGESVPRGAYAEEQINGRPVAKLLVMGDRRAQGHHERWAMLTDRERIILVDVLADHRAIRPAQAAARWLLANTQINPTERD